MAKVKFRAGKGKGKLLEYHGFKSDAKPEDVQSRSNMLDIYDGEIKEVCEADAKRLIADFPSHFSRVGSKAKAPAKPKEEKGKDAAKKP